MSVFSALQKVFQFPRQAQCLALAIGLVAASACSAPTLSIDTPEGRRAILDEVNALLSRANCEPAINLIEQLYNSEFADNEVRMVRASAHACQAGVDFFGVINGLTNSDNTFCEGSNCGGLWKSITKIFAVGDLIGNNQAKLDTRISSAFMAQDAVMAVLKDGVTVPSHYQINKGTNNVGSLLLNDRTDEANAFMFFLAMGTIGAVQNRYGQTTGEPFGAGYSQKKHMPWDDRDTVDAIGCGYAGSIVNMIESAGKVSTSLSTSVSAELSNVIDAACVAGCTVVDAEAADTDFQCGLTASVCGSTCAQAIRNRDTCLATESSRCAARALVNFINTNDTAGWPCSNGSCSTYP